MKELDEQEKEALKLKKEEALEEMKCNDKKLVDKLTMANNKLDSEASDL